MTHKKPSIPSKCSLEEYKGKYQWTVIGGRGYHMVRMTLTQAWFYTERFGGEAVLWDDAFPSQSTFGNQTRQD